MDSSQSQAVLYSYFAAFDSGDFAAARAFLHDDFAFSMPGLIATGADVYMDTSRAWKRAFPDMRHTVGWVVANGHEVCAEVTTNATHLGDLQYGTLIPATGRRVALRSFAYCLFRDGKLMRRDALFDGVDFRRQLGVP
jgi:predicted ester cyclase